MSETTSVVHFERPTGALALTTEQREWTPAQRAALSQLGLRGAPEGDLMVFLHHSQKTGLDPFVKQIYMILRSGKWAIQTGIDGYRVIAERHGQYAGPEGPWWCGEDGVWKELWASSEPPVAAKYLVYRKDWRHPAVGIAHFCEYAGRTGNGSLTSMWATRSAGQLAKCAEALALRKAFPQDLGGIYTAEEMEQADNPQPRIIIDQVPEEDQPEVDWDAEIRACVGDVGKLQSLYKRAAGNLEVRDKIAAEGRKAKAKLAEKPADPEPQLEVVDAEIVEDEPRKTLTVEDTVDILIECDIFDAAENIRKRGQSDDVKDFLDEQVCEVLGLKHGVSLRLDHFASKVATFVKRHGYSVVAGIDKPAVGSVEAA